ncbi:MULTISPECIES: GxxExxY protein [unclassified Variovorax]|uniref:GxxExxY protein n=1 Tax=unclassified Variovorax TaxID=663243 RepID=UPI001BD5F43D|nr:MULTISPECIES: GxxExxY protein [unclassified Variovorax]
MTASVPQTDFSHEIIGAAVEVQRMLGTGLSEAAYATALEVELAEREIGFQRDVPLSASYKGRPLGEVCRAGFVVEQSVVVELRAVEVLSDLHRAQVQAALRLSGLKLGLLINFNVFPVVKGIHRIVSKP